MPAHTLIVATKPKCRNCGSTLIIPDEDRKPYCLMCRRTYRDFRQYGRIGGLQTVMRYGREYMAEIGKKGGRPRLRQPAAPKAQFEIREGMAVQPNNLRVLKELWKERQGEASLRGS